MFSELTLRGIPFRPARFLAPMAEITHSAFRRLVAEFGGCGGFWTEMLAAKQILTEDLRQSPWLRRRPAEGRVIYQLMVCGTDRLDRILGRLSEIGPDGIDLNLACDAPSIRGVDAGSGLFENLDGLSAILREARRCWPGLLTVKIRLGRDAPGWKERLTERMRLFEESGVDAVILHPRFFEDKFKRRARHELYAWAASLTRLPLIANGDITGPGTIRESPALFEPTRGLMIGRMAVVRPWLFASWEKPVNADYAGTWNRLCDYVCEDFPPERALGRMKVFTKYYARNFRFGHGFDTAVQNAPTLEAARERAGAFLGASPALDAEPSLMGL